ncbi:MAG TPA: TonB family protein [Hymenobacter sp.]|jgi:protein TonB
MLPLPILNVHLTPCAADWQQMTPTAQGHHCAHCDRLVHDFTNASIADLAHARAASPDGRLCGRFRSEQLAPRPQLRPKLRRFLVALVLVCGLGLTSREAWAQVAVSRPSSPKYTQNGPDTECGKLYEYPRPTYKDGGVQGMFLCINRNVHYPKGQSQSGIVFVTFLVTKTGSMRDVKIQKGMSEPFDAEALRVVKLLSGWIPTRPSSDPSYDRFTVPVAFKYLPVATK